MRSLSISMVATTLFVIGCGQPATSPISSDSAEVIGSVPSASVDSQNFHTHASEGPHRGKLIELGNDEYHAELVHEGKSVTIYILDGSAAKVIPVAATEVTINLLHDDKPTQFKLPATADADDQSGKSSRFTLQDVQLTEALEHGHADAKLTILIDGKSYRGKIPHDHDDHTHAP